MMKKTNQGENIVYLFGHSMVSSLPVAVVIAYSISGSGTRIDNDDSSFRRRDEKFKTHYNAITGQSPCCS